MYAIAYGKCINICDKLDNKQILIEYNDEIFIT